MHTFKVAIIDFQDRKWHIKENVPSTAGWYLIRTTTPIEMLRSVGKPKHSGNCNIPKKIEAAQLLIDKGSPLFKMIVILILSTRAKRRTYYTVQENIASVVTGRAAWRFLHTLHFYNLTGGSNIWNVNLPFLDQMAIKGFVHMARNSGGFRMDGRFYVLCKSACKLVTLNPIHYSNIRRNYA